MRLDLQYRTGREKMSLFCEPPELGFQFTLHKRESQPLRCHLTQEPQAVAQVWVRGSHCAPGLVATRPKLLAVSCPWAEPASDLSVGVGSESYLAPTWTRTKIAQPQRRGPGGDLQEKKFCSHLGESRTCPGD